MFRVSAGAIVLAWLMILLIAPEAIASAGALKKCEGISTQNGYKYVGTYCVDYACTYVTTKMFDSYCPYMLPSQ
jgi:hypothetical protein